MSISSKFSILKEFWQFLMENKKWWITPIVIMLVLLGVLIIFTESASVTPFIYALF